MCFSRGVVCLGAVLLLSNRAVCEDLEEVEDDGESGTCSPENPESCSTEEKEAADKALGLVDQGNALASKGNYIEALQAYKQALDIDHTSARAANPMVNSGIALKSLGLVKEAIDALRKGVKLNPKLFHAQYNLAINLAEAQEWEEADEHYIAALEIAPASSEGHVRIARTRLLLRAFHYEEARSAFGTRDFIDEAYQVAVPLISLLKKEEKPQIDIISLVCSVLSLKGKTKELAALSQWAVKKGVWMKPDQRPTSFKLSFANSFKATPWWAGSMADLPDFLEEVGESWTDMKKELDTLMKKDKIPEAEDIDDGDFMFYDHSKGHKWSQLRLFQQGKKIANNSKIGKVAANIFSDTQVKGDHEAMVMYSVLAPGTRTFTRCGLSNVRLTCHLGLKVPNVGPEKFGISVAGEVRGLKEGAWACFDDSFEHSIFNEANEPSGVIVVQFRHPAYKGQ